MWLGIHPSVGPPWEWRGLSGWRSPLTWGFGKEVTRLGLRSLLDRGVLGRTTVGAQSSKESRNGLGEDRR